MKRLGSLFLTAVLLLSLMGSALASEVFTEQPAHVLTYDQYTQWPVVAEGEKLEVSVMIPRDDTYGIDYKDMWLWNFLPEATGITFKVEQISSAAYSERVNLAMAANDMPDILFKGGLSAADLIMYGEEEGMLLNLTSYLNEDVMPNFMRLATEFFPNLIADVTTPNGGVYSLPRVSPTNLGQDVKPYFANLDYMADAGYTEVPDTLDGFVDMLYKMKEAHPEITPLGGHWKAYNPMFYLLNAMGYLTNGAGIDIAVREGEAVIPAYDETYVEVLRLMNQFYNDEIISRDFFTLDDLTVKAHITEGKVGVMPCGILTVYSDADYDKYTHWESCTSLTSDWNQTRMCYASPVVSTGNLVISSKVSDPETVLRFLDAFYAHEGILYLHWGPEFGSGEDMDMIGGWAIDNWNVKYLNKDGTDYESVNAYLHQVTGSLAGTFGNGAFSFDHPDATPKQFKFWCFGDDIEHPQYDEFSANGYDCIHTGEMLSPYATAGYPSIMYLDADTNYDMTELKTLLNPYMETEIAKFITGQRSLDEFDAYCQELAGMGMNDYLKIYQDYWAAYTAE